MNNPICDICDEEIAHFEYWLATCPECGDTYKSHVTHIRPLCCGICAGDVGRNVEYLYETVRRV